jgi:hypothetical protein
MHALPAQRSEAAHPEEQRGGARGDIDGKLHDLADRQVPLPPHAPPQRRQRIVVVLRAPMGAISAQSGMHANVNV